VSTLFRVVKYYEPMDEEIKLLYMKVCVAFDNRQPILTYLQEIGFTHMRVLNGLSTQVQIAGLLSRLCRLKVGNDVVERLTVSLFEECFFS
jgi:replication factor C subunit 2/4